MQTVGIKGNGRETATVPRFLQAGSASEDPMLEQVKKRLNLDDLNVLHAYKEFVKERENVSHEEIKEEEPPDSYKATLEGLKGYIEAALRDSYAAGRMALDPGFPSWLRQMAGVLNKNPGVRKLRDTIEQWIADPAEARRCHKLGIEEGMPKWFVEVAAVLGARKKWEMGC